MPYERLWQPAALARVEQWLSNARAAMQALARGERAQPPRALVIAAQHALTAEAAQFVWDCRDPAACRVLQPSTAADPPASSLDAAFIASAAASVGHQDLDVVRQAASGAEAAAKVDSSIMLCFHHHGLRSCFAAAQAAVAKDCAAGFAQRGFQHLPFLPCRLVPRNIVQQRKWRLEEDGSVTEFAKPRLTTDDSWAEGGAVTARNAGIALDEIPGVNLPSARTLGEAAAILRAVALEAGVPVRVYARDIEAAYRQWGVQRAELFLQCFIFDDGVVVDERLEFGTASSPSLFQRLSRLLCTVADRQCRQWDDEHPPTSSALLQCLAQRRTLGDQQAALGWLQVFLDDINGASINDVLEACPEGRAATHFAIVGSVFNRAGLPISLPKDQLGTAVLSLGFRVSLSQQSAGISYPREKRLALAARLRTLLATAQRQRDVPRRLVEEVIGVLGHLCTVLAEGKLVLDAGYAFLYARRLKRARSFRPASLAAGAATPTAVKFRQAMHWFLDAVQEEITAPLAHQHIFPHPSGGEHAFVFVDASRLWGVGGWSLVRRGSQLTFIALAAEYPPALQPAARAESAGGLSTGALEMAAACAGRDLLRRHAAFADLVIFIDNEAARFAINAGSSASAGMRPLLHALFSHETFLAVRVSTTQNRWADMLSRGDAAKVVTEARAYGWEVELEAAVDWSALTQAAADSASAERCPTAPPYSRRHTDGFHTLTTQHALRHSHTRSRRAPRVHR
jgi:hypothetical protein